MGAERTSRRFIPPEPKSTTATEFFPFSSKPFTVPNPKLSCMTLIPTDSCSKDTPGDFEAEETAEDFAAEYPDERFEEAEPPVCFLEILTPDPYVDLPDDIFRDEYPPEDL